MPNTPPASIAAPFQTVTSDGEENLRQRKVLQDRLDNRTVGVYDERDNSILQAPIADEQKYRDLGLVVGDAEAAKKQVLNSPLGQVDAFAHHAANAASFNTYDNIAALLGQKDYLRNEKDVDEENPYSALAGDLAGGIVSSPYRTGNVIGMAASAYEGGTAAATNAYALDEPITAERLLKGSASAMMYNALFNYGPGLAAKGFRGGGKGLHALNNKFGLFLKEAENAGETVGSAHYRGGVQRAASTAGQGLASAERVAEETKSAAEKMGETLQRDPKVVEQEFYENEKAQNQALINLDGLDHESSAADKIRKTLVKHEEVAQKLSEEMGVATPSGEHIPNPDALTGEGQFEYPGATKQSQRINMWRKSFEELLGSEENHVADAARQEEGRLGNTAKQEGRLDDASRHFENKKTIERELHRRLPDSVHPDTGDIVPGFQKHINEYSRLSGNDTSGLGSLRYRAASTAEKAAIDAEITAHPDSAAQFQGDTPSQKAHIGEGEPYVPDAQKSFNESKQKLEDLREERIRGGENLSRSEIDRLNREYDLAQGVHKYNTEALARANKPPKTFASQTDIPEAPGEVNKVSDITGKTPAEQSARTVGQGGPKYLPRWHRRAFWTLNLATFGIAKTLIGAAAAANEIGPYILNNSTRFAEKVQSLADASAKGTAGALRRALSGTLGRNTAMGSTDPKPEFDRHSKMILAGQASPGSLEQGIKALLGPEAEEHPELTENIVATTGRALSAMSNALPRNVQAPTARGANYIPPRSVMVRFNRLARAVSDPDVVIANPDPDTWAAVKAAHPETAKYVEDTLMQVVANPKIKLNKQQARNVSVLLGQAITPQNQPEYLKSMHDLVTLSQASNPPDQAGKPSSGGQSAKTGQQMLSLDATPQQQNQLNL